MAKNPHIDLVAAWRTSNRVTEFLIENLPPELWNEKIPGMPQRKFRMLAGHIHNARCMWIKMIGKQYGITPPKNVDRRKITRASLLKALKSSNERMTKLLSASLSHNARLKMEIPWSNIPPDAFHFTAYMVAHEAHHRGQLVLAARQTGHRLPPSITNGLWQWKQRSTESKNSRPTRTR